MLSFTSAEEFFVSNSQSKKIQIYSKIPCPQSPSFLVPRPCWLREAKRAVGMRMGFIKEIFIFECFQRFVIIRVKRDTNMFPWHRKNKSTRLFLQRHLIF